MFGGREVFNKLMRKYNFLFLLLFFAYKLYGNDYKSKSYDDSKTIKLTHTYLQKKEKQQ